MEIKRKYYKCECETHLLTLEKWEDDQDAELDEFCIATFSMTHRGNLSMTWRERFRWCWQILRKGNVWADMVTLTRKDAKQLAADIEEMTYQNPFDEEK